MATKQSGYRWGYWHDPAISNEKKMADHQSGGRKASHENPEVEEELDRVMAKADKTTLEGLADLRRRLLPLAHVVRPRVYDMVLRNISGLEANLRAQTQRPTPTPPPGITFRYGQNGETSQ